MNNKSAHLSFPTPITAPLNKPLKLTPPDKLALETLKIGTNGNVPGGSIHVDEWRPLFYEGHTGDTVDAKTKAFSRTRERLVKKGLIEVSDDYYSVRDSGT